MTVQTHEDPVVAEIAALRERQKAIRDRIEHLQKLRGRPAVVPVLHFWRHHHEYAEPAFLWDDNPRDPLESAFRELEGQSDMGACAADGVSVGGVFYPMDDLYERFGYAS